MKEKQLLLIKALMDNSGWVTSTFLASTLDITSRSVKNYIVDINKAYPNTIQSSRNGYRIDLVSAKRILDENQDDIPQSSQDRTSYIINALVQEERVDTYLLCEELYISMSTLKNELKKVKRKLVDYDLQLISNSDYLSIEGIEKNKRKLVSSILYDESSINFVNLKAVQNAFNDINIDFIKDTVINTFSEYHYFVNDYSLTNLVLHITIAIDRIRNNYSSFVMSDNVVRVKLHEFEMTKKIASKLEDYFSINFNNGEIYELTLLLISHANTMSTDSSNVSDLRELVGDECYELVNELVNDINVFYYINLSEPEFLTRFALHIRNLLVRSKNNYSSKNPLANGIQLTCPLIYELSVNLSSIIEERTGLKINQDEVAYIAFHIGSALETQKAISSKINVALYCPNYYDMNQRLVQTINDNFSSSILIKNVITDENELDLLVNCDLIISTIQISKILSIPTIVISFLINEKDIYQIRNKIDGIKIDKNKAQFKSNLVNIIKPEFFERNNVLKTFDETIKYMTNKMIEHDCVDDNFINEIIDRENIASTAFHSFAIPHALKMKAKKTCMNILISNTGIDWNGTNVNLVIMLSFNKQERYIFVEIFDTLTMILTEQENINKILKVSNYGDFIDILVSFIDKP